MGNPWQGCNNSDTVVITVHPAPAADVGINNLIDNCDTAHNSIIIGATSVSGHTYSWTSNPSGFTSTLAKPTVSPTVNTTYTLTERITATGCTHANSLNVFVQPANTQVNLKLHFTQPH